MAETSQDKIIITREEKQQLDAFKIISKKDRTLNHRRGEESALQMAIEGAKVFPIVSLEK